MPEDNFKRHVIKDSRYANIKVTNPKISEKIWSVKAWLTQNPSQETIIAYVDDLTGRVIYVDPEAKTDSFAQIVIKDILDQIGEHHVSVSISPYGQISLKLKSKRGIFEANADPGCDNGADEDGMFLSIQLSENPYVVSDLLAAKTNGEDIEMHIWSDVFDEDPQGDPIVLKGTDLNYVMQKEKGEES
jgi:hypothetical protein